MKGTNGISRLFPVKKVDSHYVHSLAHTHTLTDPSSSNILLSWVVLTSSHRLGILQPCWSLVGETAPNHGLMGRGAHIYWLTNKWSSGMATLLLKQQQEIVPLLLGILETTNALGLPTRLSHFNSPDRWCPAYPWVNTTPSYTFLNVGPQGSVILHRHEKDTLKAPNQKTSIFYI